MADPIKEFLSFDEFKNFDHKKRIVIGYFDRKDVPEYKSFQKVARNLREDCQFYVGFE